MSETYVKVKFKGATFDQIEANEEIGNRLVVHEYPQRNTPFIEPMGRKTRKWNIKAICAGDGWDTKRDNLKSVCEQTSSGVLLHPSYGELNVYCETCHVSNFYVNGIGKAEIDLTFVEAGLGSAPLTKTNTKLSIQNSVTSWQDKVRAAFNTLGQLQQLPQTALNYLTDMVTTYTGLNPYQILSTVDALQSLGQTSITDALFPKYLSAYFQTFRSSFIDSATNTTVGQLTGVSIPGVSQPYTINTSTFSQTFPYEDNKHNTTVTSDTGEVLSVSITPAQIITLHDDVITSALAFLAASPLPTNTPSAAVFAQTADKLAVFVASACCIEQVAACTYLSFASTNEAQAVWSGVINNLDAVIEIAGNTRDDATYTTLIDVKAAFLVDIKERSETLKTLKPINVQVSTPSLVLAYQLYGDISRESEIIKRNNINNPAFIAGQLIVLNN